MESDAFPDGRELHAYGVNHDTYVKVDDRWLVASATMEPRSSRRYSAIVMVFRPKTMLSVTRT